MANRDMRQKLAMLLASRKKSLYDSEVEYLESTGYEFIDLGIVPNDSTGVKIWFEPIGEGQVCGLYKGTKGYTIGCNRISGALGNWGNYLTNVPFTSGSVSLNFCNDRAFKVAQDGATETSEALGTLPFSPTIPMYLFGFNYAGTFYGTNTRISRFKVSQGPDVILDFIPVRVGTTGYMYDIVSGQLFGNSGTRDFIVGNDIN